MPADRISDAKRESKTLDFKSEFDPDDQGSWCEVIKDVVAMANTAGGMILVGVENDGSCNHSPTVDAVLSIDPAIVTDKIAKYTRVQYDGLSITEGHRRGVRIAVLRVAPVMVPMVFEKSGNYSTPEGKQKNAFTTGSLYVRHGAKSEPANSRDLNEIVERNLNAARREWITGVRQVISAPAGSVISVLPAELTNRTGDSATPIRVTSDPEAPEFKLVDPDVTHPWRQKELIAQVNRELDGAYTINQFDILAVRHVHAVASNPQFFHKPLFGAPQYSRAFASWLVGEFRKDNTFFGKNRDELKRQRSEGKSVSDNLQNDHPIQNRSDRVVRLPVTKDRSFEAPIAGP
jgi:hypothetical protein